MKIKILNKPQRLNRNKILIKVKERKEMLVKYSNKKVKILRIYQIKINCH
jgi:hypothetical protein